MHKVDSEVVIDFALAFRHINHHGWRPEIGFIAPTPSDPRECHDFPCQSKTCTLTHFDLGYDDTKIDKLLMNRYIDKDGHILFKERRYDATILEEEQLILLPNRVFGFALRSRNWGE